MSDDRVRQAAELCRQAAETLDGAGAFRLRVLMQMLLQEFEKEPALRDDGGDEDRQGLN